MTEDQFSSACKTLLKAYGGSVTSWGRSRAHTIVVGGFAGDPHTWWLGLDAVYDTGPNCPALDEHARAMGLKVLHERGHDHFQPADFPAGPVTEYPAP